MKISLSVLFFLWLVCLPARSQTPVGPLSDKEIADETQIVQEIRDFRKFLVRMVEIVKSDASLSSKDLAVSAIREFRYVDAIPVLVQNLIVIPRRYRQNADQVAHIGQYACALALKDIGLPSVDPLISLIRKSSNSAEIEVGTFTMAEILGKDVALSTLHSATDINNGGRASRNLDLAIQILDAEK